MDATIMVEAIKMAKWRYDKYWGECSCDERLAVLKAVEARYPRKNPREAVDHPKGN